MQIPFHTVISGFILNSRWTLALHIEMNASFDGEGLKIEGECV